MSSAIAADTGGMAGWALFTNHMHVLTALAQRPDLRLREIAREVGITERATHRIVSELVNDGYLTRERIGARNRYEIDETLTARLPLHAQCNVGQVMRLLGTSEERSSTEQRASHEETRALSGSAETLRAAFAVAPGAMVLADATGRFLAVNPAYCSLLGYQEEELVGRTFRESTHRDDVAAGDDEFDELLAGERAEYAGETRFIHRDGSITWVKLHIASTVDAATQTRLLVANVTDINDRKRQEQALAEAEERFTTAFDNAPIGMSLVTPDGRWLKVNRSLCELTGYAETALLVRSVQTITHPDDVDAGRAYVKDVLADKHRTDRIEKRYYHADGHVIWVIVSASLVRDASGDPLYFISQIEDITERKHREQALRDQAEQRAILAATDPVTGLSTRRALDGAITERMRATDKRDEPLAVAVITFDGLRELNALHGPHAGDRALRAMGAALQASLREGDLVARFGHDELAILIPATSTEKMRMVTERFINALPKAQSASAGAAVWDGHESSSALLKRADQALYAAKRAGKNKVLVADTRAPASAPSTPAHRQPRPVAASRPASQRR